ncbi:MAG: L,D-transpeptidase family protein [Vulcanimicrobiota bacterium]
MGLTRKPAQIRCPARGIRTGIGTPQSTRLGDQVGLHGGGTRHDWTLGCIALSDQDISVLCDRLDNGAVVGSR